MAIKEDIKRDETGGRSQDETDEPVEERAESSEGPASGGEGAEADRADSAIVRSGDDGHDDESDDAGGAVSPQQLGTQRFVYGAYFAGAIGIAFIVSKILDYAWFRAQTYRPAIGEPREEIVMPVAALLGGGAAVYYWVRTRARELAEEVAAEMAKVTWPNRTEVTNGTVVVIVTTIVSTVFFALMDRFWGFVSNLVYGGT